MQGLQIIIGFMSDCFNSQTNVAAFDIGLNIFLEVRQIIFPAYKLFCFIDTKMACQKIVVMLTDKLRLNDFGYKR